MGSVGAWQLLNPKLCPSNESVYNLAQDYKNVYKVVQGCTTLYKVVQLCTTFTTLYKEAQFQFSDLYS